jgi:hypothetical protein
LLGGGGGVGGSSSAVVEAYLDHYVVQGLDRVLELFCFFGYGEYLVQVVLVFGGGFV